jgi:hypothetical protein
MKSTLLFSLAVMLIAGAADAAGKRQVCSGVLTKDEDGGHLLKPDAGSSLWCDAYIGDDFHTGDASVSRVLKVCAVGGRCHIEGSFVGHGVFFWKHISSVSRIQ